MAERKANKTELAREFSAVHDTIRDFCYRGYRSRNEMDRIGVGISTYDNRLKKQIECMLNETDALQNGKFVYKPMEWQANPLAEVFRYVIPDEQDFVYYYAILSALKEKKEDDFNANIGDSQGLTLTELCDIIKEYLVNGEKEISRQQVKRKLGELCKHCQIEQRKDRYVLKDIILDEWYNKKEERYDSFTIEELLKIYNCVFFLENVEPFALPFFLLRKNIELWMKKERCKEFEEYDKEMFLFRHRNPVNVLDSELIYACLLLAKNNAQKDFSCYLNIAPYEINLEKVNRNYLPVTLNVDHLEFNRETGAILVSDASVNVNGIEQCEKKIPLRNLSFYKKTKKKSKNEKGFTKNNSLDVECVFHSLNSVFFERLVELSFLEDKSTWTEEELIEHFFQGEKYWYSDVFERVVRGKKKTPQVREKKREQPYEPKAEVSCFLEDKKEGTFRWIYSEALEWPVFYTPRLAQEAMKNIPKTQFWNLFFGPELRDKIEQATEEYESTWDISDIVWSNEKENELLSEENIKFAKKLIENFRDSGLIYDCQNKEYYMLRIQYSIRKDEFRVLAQETSGKKGLTIISRENIVFKPKRADKESLIHARNSYKDKLSEYTTQKNLQI